MSTGIDKMLEERFRHILTQEKWIPPTPSVSSETPAAVLSGGDRVSQNIDARKCVGVALTGGALIGLLFVWRRGRR